MKKLTLVLVLMSSAAYLCAMQKAMPHTQSCTEQLLGASFESNAINQKESLMFSTAEVLDCLNQITGADLP